MSRGFQLTPQGRIQVSEKDVTKACLDLLRIHHWWPIRQHVGRFLPGRAYGLLCAHCREAVRKSWITIGETGDPDYAVIKAPSFFLELKRPGGALSQDQEERHFQLENFYGLQTIKASGPEELRDYLRRRERSP